MVKKILIAMDESDYAKKAVKYVASAVRPTVHITLFSVMPTISSKLERELHHPLFAEKVEGLKGITAEKKKLVEVMMEECRTILKDADVHDKNIEVRIVNKKVGIARDIIAEAEQGGYDTVVVGRRGLSAAAAFVLGSISNKIVQNIKNCTVWIVE
jgi:nucleotide-binding universal stress UspA family protein